MKYCSVEDPTRCSPSFPPSLYTTHKFPGDPEKDFLLLITFRFTFKYLQHIPIVAQPEVINAIITTNAAVVHPSRLFKVLTSSIPRLGNPSGSYNGIEIYGPPRSHSLPLLHL